MAEVKTICNGISHAICNICKNDCFFSLITEEESDILMDNIHLIKYRKGETIFKQKTYLTNILFLQEGILKSYIEGTNGKNIILDINVPVDFVGLGDAFNKQVYAYSALALTECKVLSIDHEVFKLIMSKNSKFSEVVFSWFTEHNNFLYRKISNLGTKQMHGRLADAILYLSQERFAKQNVFSYLSRSDIAEFTGMSKENAIRLLTEFKNDGLVTVNAREIIINRLELLTKLQHIG